MAFSKPVMSGIKLSEHNKIMHCIKYHEKHCTRSICNETIFYNVPIYNPHYYDCAEFATGNQFPIKDFAQKCITIACKTDLVETKILRQTKNTPRIRKNITINSEPPPFIKNVPNKHYRTLFAQCFTKQQNQKLNVQLKNYAKKKIRKKLIIFSEGYDINKSKINTLYLLMNLYTKFFSSGINNINKYYPPWHIKSDIEKTANKFVSKKTETINLLGFSVTIDCDNDFNIEYK